MSLTQLQYDCLKDSVSRWSEKFGTDFNYVKVLSDSVDWGFQFNHAIGDEVAEVEGWTSEEDIYIFFIGRDFIIRDVQVVSAWEV
jgi:hypothetical protein